MCKESQDVRVLQALKDHEYITSDFIVYSLGIPRASAKIFVLKERGYNIGAGYKRLGVFKKKSKYTYWLIK